MESQAFSHWLAQLSQLSIKQRSLVQRALHEPVPRGVPLRRGRRAVGRVGVEPRIASLPLPGVPSNVQCVDGDATGSSAQG